MRSLLGILFGLYNRRVISCHTGNVKNYISEEF